jgi:hypothetical protein
MHGGGRAECAGPGPSALEPAPARVGTGPLTLTRPPTPTQPAASAKARSRVWGLVCKNSAQGPGTPTPSGSQGAHWAGGFTGRPAAARMQEGTEGTEEACALVTPCRRPPPPHADLPHTPTHTRTCTHAHVRKPMHAGGHRGHGTQRKPAHACTHAGCSCPSTPAPPLLPRTRRFSQDDPSPAQPHAPSARPTTRCQVRPSRACALGPGTQDKGQGGAPIEDARRHWTGCLPYLTS